MKKYGIYRNAVRVLRLFSGVFVIFAGVQTKDWLLTIGGGLLSLMALVNAGCSTSACYRPAQQKNRKAEEIIYEEIR